LIATAENDGSLIATADRIRMTATRTKSNMSAKALIKRSWQLLLDNWAIVIGAVFFHALRNTAIAIILLFFVIDLPAGPFILLGVIVALCMASYLDIPSICLNIARGKPAKLSIVPNLPRTIVWLTASVIFAIACAVGLVLLVIPGLIVAVLFSMYGFGIVDGDNPIKSLSKSYSIARSKFPQICLLFLSFFILSLIPNPLHLGFTVALDVALTFGLCLIYTSDYGGSG